MKPYESGSGVRFLNSKDMKKYGTRIEIIGKVSDAMKTLNVKELSRLKDICLEYNMCLLAKNIDRFLDSV